MSKVRPILLAMAFALAGCGGGGDYGVASTPPPATTPPPPPPPPAIVPAATTSQQFAVAGATHLNGDVLTPRFDDSEQLQVRYVASSNSYEVKSPRDQDWAAVSYHPDNGGFFINSAGTAGLTVRPTSTQYSTLISWGAGTEDDSDFGIEAVGIATLPGSVPLTGSASYSGQLRGNTWEVVPTGPNSFSGAYVAGSIALSFDFGLGSLSGSVSPTLINTTDSTSKALGTINFLETVYSRGSTTFSGRFDTSLPGVNSFSGLFTGPNAQELIGNFAFPYQSPIDGKTYQADGAFVGGK